MNVVVTGGTGTIGRELVRQLVASGAARTIRVLTRDVASAKARLRDVASRIELVAGDLADPQTLPPAFSGMDKAFVLTMGLDLPRLEGNAFDAAKEARLHHVVKLSALEAFEPYLANTALADAHIASEARLRASGLAWTMIRPGSFSTNVLPGGALGPFIRDPKQGEVRLPAGDGAEVPIDPHDIAAASLVAIRDEKGDTLSRSYEITGRERLTFSEMFEAMNRAHGTDLRHVDCPEEEARAHMIALGVPPGFADSVMRHFAAVRAGQMRMTSDLEALLGRPPRTFADWLVATRGR